MIKPSGRMAGPAPAVSSVASSSHTLSSNMYRVGDFVYFEVHAGQPYQVRRIEELNRTSSGVEVRVQCFYRRRDIPTSLIHMADKHYCLLEEEEEIESTQNLSDEMKHQLRHRELFLSRQAETVPAQYIRGKCSVNLLSEVESMMSYLEKKDQFFYTLVFDPVQRTLLADRGEIRVGNRFQAEVQAFKQLDASTYRSEALEEQVWHPSDGGLDDEEINGLITMTRSVGTLARAADTNLMHNREYPSSSQSSSSKDPGLLHSVSMASRDISIEYAYTLIHRHSYNPEKVMQALVPDSGPLLIRDQIEEWSSYEAHLFEDALDKLEKDFAAIKEKILPWKTLPSIIEYYYMWKTTDRYMRQKRVKAADVENKLKQVYIPSDGSVNNPNKTVPTTKVICEGCETYDAKSWFLWGPNNACRVCETCWVYWKKFGGLVKPNVYEGNIITSTVSAESARYECKNCGKLFNRQERLISHMASHGEYTCTVGSCDKDFKSRNQLHRHLATAHRLVLTKKDTYVQAVRSRATFLLVTTPMSRFSRNLCPTPVKTLARCPCSEVNHDLCHKVTKEKIKEAGGKFQKANLKAKPPLVNFEDLVTEIKKFNENTESMENKSKIEFPLKRKTTNIMPSSKIRRINWLEMTDGVLFMQTEKTQKVRNLLSVPEQKKLGRRPNRLAIADVGLE